MKIRNRHKSLIRGWRNKLIFLLVVYFAGFATAVYCLAPVQDTGNQSSKKGFVHSVLKSDEFATTFNEGLHKFIHFNKSAALRTAGFIKEEYNKIKAQSES